jgi:fused signal recognition particle receptor
MAFFGLFGKHKEVGAMERGLERTRTGFFANLAKAVAGRSTVDDEVLDALEETLVSSDVGVDTTLKIVKAVQARVARDKYLGTAELGSILRQEIGALLHEPDEGPLAERPHVIMVVGVNGVGKTTTIGKLAHAYKQSGKSVLLGAADTFRAAAVDQLKVWSERSGAAMVSQGMGADPAAVAYDTVESAKAKGADVAIIDTAGRLHNKVNLMAELTKVRNVMAKVVPGAPHEVLLVLDATTGQNAFEQAKEFTRATAVTGLVLTKIDGTAKGGVAIGISDRFQVPIRYLGVGEGMHDLQPFSKEAFVQALFGPATV